MAQCQVQHLLAEEELEVALIALIRGGHPSATTHRQGPRTGGHMHHLILEEHLILPWEGRWGRHCHSRVVGTETLED